MKMQNPNEDTEWNDVLRAKGILPPKPKEAEINEDDLVQMLEDTIKQKSGGMLSEALEKIFWYYLNSFSSQRPCRYGSG